MANKRTVSKRKAKELERKQKRLAAQKALRDEFGYTKLAEAGIKSKRPEFPNLKVESRASPTTALFGPTPAPKPLPPDAKQFPIGHSHKQGYELMLPSEVQYLNGKKT